MPVETVPQLSDCLIKHKVMPPPSAAGLPYPDLVHMYRAMVAQDPRIVFDSTRPLADEFWNLIDGRRTIDQIARYCCFEFGFTLDGALFLPFARQLLAAELVTIAGRENSANKE